MSKAINMGADLSYGAGRARPLATRTGGILLLAGGLLAIVTSALPPPAQGSDTAVTAIGVLAIAAGIGILLRRRPLGDAQLAAIPLLGTALITLATREGGFSGAAADNAVLYLWVGLYSFYFLPMRAALLQVGAIGVAYGWLLSGQSAPDEAATRWIVVMATLIVAGLVVAALRASHYRLIDALSERARQDGLTGLLNRRAFEERFAVERARSIRHSSPASLIALDLDGFKSLNDSLGHASGDQVLRQLATALRERTRALDAVGRMGGDEFAVLLPEATEAEARTVSEDLRVALSRALRAAGEPVTVSIGIATMAPPVPPFEEVWRAADAAMYAAKRAGGDRACVMAAPGGDRTAAPPG